MSIRLAGWGQGEGLPVETIDHLKRSKWLFGPDFGVQVSSARSLGLLAQRTSPAVCANDEREFAAAILLEGHFLNLGLDNYHRGPTFYCKAGRKAVVRRTHKLHPPIAVRFVVEVKTAGYPIKMAVLLPTQ
jgi:hypothetical protein